MTVNQGFSRSMLHPLEGNTTCADEARLFARWLAILNESGIGYAVAGSFAVHAYTGILRKTKDLDVYISPRHLKSALHAFQCAGYCTEVRDPAWLAKVCQGASFMDLIFAVSQQRFQIDDRWFEKCRSAEFSGIAVSLLSMEELVVSKVYLAKGYRFDGADILHLIRSAGGALDWERILGYLGEDRLLLLWYLLLFDFVYPGHSDFLPKELMVDLFDEVRAGWENKKVARSFRGTLIDPGAFEVDIASNGYEDRGEHAPLVDDEGNLL